jgi:hypothetical protein
MIFHPILRTGVLIPVCREGQMYDTKADIWFPPPIPTSLFIHIDSHPI